MKVKDLVCVLDWHTKIEITTGLTNLYEGKVGDMEGKDLLELTIYLVTPEHNSRENYLEVLVEV